MSEKRFNDLLYDYALAYHAWRLDGADDHGEAHASMMRAKHLLEEHDKSDGRYVYDQCAPCLNYPNLDWDDALAEVIDMLNGSVPLPRYDELRQERDEARRLLRVTADIAEKLDNDLGNNLNLGGDEPHRLAAWSIHSGINECLRTDAKEKP